MKCLNKEGVRGRKHEKKNWATNTVARMLDNEKYIGKWVWHKSENRRDPKTGRTRKFPKPESEWITQHDDSLRVVSQDLWENRSDKTTKGGKNLARTEREARIF